MSPIAHVISLFALFSVSGGQTITTISVGQTTLTFTEQQLDALAGQVTTCNGQITQPYAFNCTHVSECMTELVVDSANNTIELGELPSNVYDDSTVTLRQIVEGRCENGYWINGVFYPPNVTTTTTIPTTTTITIPTTTDSGELTLIRVGQTTLTFTEQQLNAVAGRSTDCFGEVNRLGIDCKNISKCLIEPVVDSANNTVLLGDLPLNLYDDTTAPLRQNVCTNTGYYIEGVFYPPTVTTTTTIPTTTTTLNAIDYMAQLFKINEKKIVECSNKIFESVPLVLMNVAGTAIRQGINCTDPNACFLQKLVDAANNPVNMLVADIGINGGSSLTIRQVLKKQCPILG